MNNISSEISPGLGLKSDMSLEHIYPDTYINTNYDTNINKTSSKNLIILFLVFILIIICCILSISYNFDFTLMINSIIALSTSFVIFILFCYIIYYYFYGPDQKPIQQQINHSVYHQMSNYNSDNQNQLEPINQYQLNPMNHNENQTILHDQYQPNTMYQYQPNTMNQYQPNTMNQYQPNTMNQYQPNTMNQYQPNTMNQYQPISNSQIFKNGIKDITRNFGKMTNDITSNIQNQKLNSLSNNINKFGNKYLPFNYNLQNPHN